MEAAAWHAANCLGLLLTPAGTAARAASGAQAVALLFNASLQIQAFSLPLLDLPGQWHCEFSSSSLGSAVDQSSLRVDAHSCACVVYRR
jgi:hypothetical protein